MQQLCSTKNIGLTTQTGLQQGEPEGTDHRAGLHATLVGIGGAHQVAQRYTRAGGINLAIEAVHQRLKVIPLIKPEAAL